MTRKRQCSECGRAVFICGPKHSGGKGRMNQHELCDLCWRREYSKLRAARLGPKPWWAMRPTLRILNAEPIQHGRLFTPPSSAGATATPDLGGEE
jgi:hypothetical protein